MKGIMRLICIAFMLTFVFAELCSFGVSMTTSAIVTVLLFIAEIAMVKQYQSGTLAMRFNSSGIGMSGFSGKLGSSVAAKGKGNAYVRLKVKPHNPNTAFQATSRSNLRSLSQGWRGLTAAQITAWNAAAINFPRKNKIGNTIILSGADLYISLNLNLKNIGVAALTTPPNPTTVLTPLGVTVTGAAGVLTMSWTSGAVPAGTTWEIWGTPGLSPGKSFVKSQFRLFTTFPAATASGAGVAIFTTPYTARFGAYIIGAKLFFYAKAVLIATGQTSKSNIATVTPAS
jgi:hypothetical protein